jgi:hypothetical protein
MSGTKQECAGSAGIKLTAREVEDAPATEADRGAQPREYSRCAGAQRLSASQFEDWAAWH